MTMLYLILLVLFIIALYKYSTCNYDYWKKKKIPFDQPKLFFGSIKDAAFFHKNIPQIVGEIYRKYSKSPFVGFYKMRTPCLLLTTPELIEEAFVHGSDSFWKNELTVEPSLDPVLAGMLFSNVGQKWKKNRELFTPILTTRKIKQVLPFLVEGTKDLIDHIHKNKTLEARDLTSRYVADANALSAFGVVGNSFKDDNAVFRQMSQTFMDPTITFGLKIFVMVVAPNLAKLLRLKIISASFVEYVKKTIKIATKYRYDNQIKNNHIIDQILKLTKNDKKSNEMNLLSFAFSFILDPTTANQESYVLYSLASHLGVQKKLQIEIDEVLKKYDDKITFDAIQEMSYLDCVISETLRLYPAVQINMKRCTGYFEFKVKNDQDQIVSVEPGMSIAASVIGMHHDERYFKYAQEFIPERFSEKNKNKIIKGTYIPFGIGKRYCAGMKLAVYLMKISTIAIIKEFEISVNPKTGNPFDLNPFVVMAIPKSGLWIDFKARNNKV
nr:cytochrome P450 6j1-like [Onthophagus taurus]